MPRSRISEQPANETGFSSDVTAGLPQATFAKVRRQIAYDPCDRRVRRASPEQLDYLARLIVACEGKPGFRWDYTHPEAFTAFRAKQMIESLKQVAA
jgi:hypothetical protein